MALPPVFAPHPARANAPRSPRRRLLWTTLPLLFLLAVLPASDPDALGTGPRNAPDVVATVTTALAGKHIRIGVDYLPPPPKRSDYQIRRAEGFATVIGDDLTQYWGARVELVALAPQDRAAALREGRVDALLLRLGDDDLKPGAFDIVPSGYAPALTGVMRSDTRFESWDALAGGRFCISDGNDAARQLSQRLGAVVVPAAVPAKALAAMRAGDCDAAIEDADLISRMVGLPRWTKFAATLPPRDREPLVFAVAHGDRQSAAVLGAVVQRWARQGQWAKWLDAWVDDVDYEAYLEQDAPDCH